MDFNLLDNFKKNTKLELESTPYNTELICRLANIEIELGNLLNAYNILYNASKTNPSINVFNNLGYFYLYIGKWQNERWHLQIDEAIKVLEKSIQMLPTSYNSYGLIGEAYLRKGMFEMAEQNLLKALSINKTLTINNNLGVAFLGQGKIKKACEYFYMAHLLRDDSNYTYYPYLNYGVALSMINDIENASFVADNLMKLLSTNFEGEVDHFDIAKIYFGCNNYQKVVNLIDEVIDNYMLGLNDFEIYVYSLIRVGQNQKALMILQEIILEKEEFIIELNDDKTLSKREKKERVSAINNDIQQFKTSYSEVIVGKVPEIEKKVFIEKGCYLFECIKHSKS